MNSILNIFNQNSSSAAGTGNNQMPTSSYPTADGSSSLLNCFDAPPPRPNDKPAYGVYELNAIFEYGYSPDFDQNLITKHQLPNCDRESDSVIDNLLINNNNSTQSTTLDKQPLFRRLLNVYYENGVLGVLEEIQSPSLSRSSNFKIPKVVVNAAGLVIKFVDLVHAPINPWLLSKKQINLDASALKGAEWEQSEIRLLEWHPRYNKFAVAQKNDIVKVYAKNCPPVVLKHQKQTKVSCIAWKHFSSSLLAIGCAERIIIWDTESLPISIKPASSCSFVLSRSYHNDITDLQWYPNSDFLVSISSRDNQILIWDVAMKECVPIKRLGTAGFGLARFSPNGERLFTADLSTTFRIWNPINYSSEKWTNLVSRCNSACWSPDGTVLLFSCHTCPLIYSLRFMSNNKQELTIACDLSATVLEDPIKTEDEKKIIGGDIKQIAWDPTGQRLAVSFKRAAQNQMSVIATFITKTHPNMQILPCGLITSWDQSFPSTICFKPLFDDGALLTIAWANSRIQHVPFYFDKLNQADEPINLGKKTIANISFLP